MTVRFRQQFSSVPLWASAKVSSTVRAYYGMEWKEKIGMEYGMAQVWNGRFDVWNGTNLPYSIQIPYSHILTWCCWSPFFLSIEHISKQSLSSTRTVIRKLRAFFVISVTNSNVDAKRRSLILILFSWGQGTLPPDFCMFTSVLAACLCVRRDSYLASIASNAALQSKTWLGILWQNNVHYFEVQ